MKPANNTGDDDLQQFTTFAPQTISMHFQKSEIGFSVTHSLPALVSDYLSGKESLKPFYAFSPDPGGFRQAIEKPNASATDRKTLVEVLLDQNRQPSAETKKNIDALLRDDTYTVTTGHQLNLFTGPLFFVYKILTAIRLSQLLREQHPGKNFVPVYWMASEDHDLDEINHTFIYGKRIEWKPTAKGAAGRLPCEGMQPVIEELKQLLGESAHAKKIIDLISISYRQEYTLSNATRIFVSGLFSRYGLIILDADDKRLKSLFIPVMKEELLKQSTFGKVTGSIEALHLAGYDTQVRPRELNLFYLSENARERIVKENGSYRVLNSSIQWNEKEVLDELAEHPDRFSPNVVLRPLYQATILPDIAYVGGPAEIAYWLEYKDLFDHYNLNFPVLLNRNSVLVIDDLSRDRMRKLHISEEDLFKTTDELIKEWVQKSPGSFLMTEEILKINSAYDSLVQKAGNVDPTLAKSIEGERQKQLNALRSIEEKMTRAEKKKHETSVQQIQKLKEKFFPGGTLQERHENFIPFYLKYGESFFDELLGVFNFPGTGLLVLTEGGA